MGPDSAGKARTTSDIGPLGAPAVDDASGRALYVTVTLGLLDISLVDHKPEELLTASLAGLRLEFAAGIGPEGSFQRMRVSVQSVQIDDQMFASRWVAGARAGVYGQAQGTRSVQRDWGGGARCLLGCMAWAACRAYRIE